MKNYDDQDTILNLPTENQRGWYKLVHQVTRPMLPDSAYLLRYAFAVVIVLIAVVFRISFNSLFDVNSNVSGPFLILYSAVLLTAWYAGFGPGILATILAILFRNFVILDASKIIDGFIGEDIANQIIFFIEGLLSSLLCLVLRKSLQRADLEIVERKRVEASLREQSERFSVTLSSIGDAVVATDAAGRVTFLNKVASDLMGWQPNEAYGQPLNNIFKIVNEQNRSPVENPVDKVLASGKIVGLANHTVLIAKNGNEVAIDDSGAPIRDNDGNIIGVVLVFRDISERKIAEHRQEILVKANVLFNSSLDYEVTLFNILHLVVPELTDWCSIYLKEGQQLRRLDLAHYDPATKQWNMGGLDNYHPEDAPNHPIHQVMATGEAVIVKQVTERLIRKISPDEESLQQFQIIKPKSVVYIPLKIRKEVVGVIVFMTAESGRIYDDDDIEFLQELSNRVVIAMDNARLFQQQQQSLVETERARQQLAFLARVSEILSTGLDYQLSLEKLARLVVPFIADYCLIDVVENADEIAKSKPEQKPTPIVRRAAVAHVNPEKENLLVEVNKKYPPNLSSDWGIGKVIRDGEVSYYEEVDDAVRVKAASSPEHLEALRELASQSGVSLPLTARGRVIGVLTLSYSPESGRKYTEEEVNLGRELARRAAIALDNARLYNESLIGQERQTYLAEASRVLSSSLNYETTFQSVAILTVPRLADWCTVHVLPLENPDAKIPRQVALAHVDPEKVRWVQELQKKLETRYPYDPNAPTGLAHVIRTGEPETYPDFPDELLVAMAGSDTELLQILREMNYASGMIVPIVVREQVLGAIQFVTTKESGKHYNSNDLILAQSLADRVALALDNARLYNESLEGQERQTYLAEASQVLSSSLDYETTFQSLAKLTVPRLADWCSVHVLPLDGNPNAVIPRQVAVAHVDPEKIRWAEEMRVILDERYPYNPDAPTGLPAVIRTGQPEILPDVPEQILQELFADDAEMLHVFQEIGFSSTMTVPMIARDKVLGAIQFVTTKESGKHYDTNDLILAQDLANRAALALDNARLYKEAQDAIALRNEFLSIAAHELKTPITSLQGFAQLQLRRIERAQKAAPQLFESNQSILPNTLDLKTLRQSLDTINFQSDKLRRLVERLLDLSRSEAGRLILEPSPVNLVTLVQDVVKMAQMISSRHQVTVEASEPEFIASLDRLRFEQVVSNLVENAIKYSPDGGEIKISIKRVPNTDSPPDQVALTICDKGIGIAPEQIDQIFQRFYQAHTGKFGGMGLGLYVSRQIVELHGGHITVESSLGNGSCFTITMPLVTPLITLQNDLIGSENVNS